MPCHIGAIAAHSIDPSSSDFAVCTPKPKHQAQEGAWFPKKWRTSKVSCKSGASHDAQTQKMGFCLAP
eukprot:4978707-Prymnesium_polylepis.1